MNGACEQRALTARAVPRLPHDPVPRRCRVDTAGLAHRRHGGVLMLH